MLKNVLYLFDLIYKLFKLQFCILTSLIIGLFIFSLGPTLYATSAVINEIVNKESNSIVRSYSRYFCNSIKATVGLGLLYIAFIASSILFAYNIRIHFGGTTFALLSNLYYFLVLVALISLFITVSISRDYELRKFEALKQSLRIMIKAPFVPLFIVLWTIAASIIFSTIFGLYIVLGFAMYLGGVFLIVNIFIKENEGAVKR